MTAHVSPGEPAPSPHTAGDDDSGMATEEFSSEDVTRHAGAGAKWGLLSNLIQQVGRLVFTLVLARIVGPQDFGIVAQAVIYVGFAQLLLDQGFGAALVQKRKLGDQDIGSVLWLNVAASVVLAALTLLVAPLVAEFFQTPEVTPVLRVMSLVLLLYGLTVVPMSLMNRNLRFRSMAMIDVVSVVTGGVAGVVVAVAGGGYWAIVVQTLVSAGSTLIGLLLLNGRPPMSASWQSLRSLMSFSMNLFGARLVSYSGVHADNVLVGKFLGPVDLAFYALSYRMLTLPIQTFGRMVNQVAFPIFSRFQHEPERIKDWFLLCSRATALFTYPFLGLALVLVPDLLPFVMGERWEPAVVPMQLFTIVAFRVIVSKLAGPVFMSLGRTRTIFRISIVEVGSIIAGCAIGLRWGLVGVAAGYTIARYLTGPLIIGAVKRSVPLRGREYVGALLPVWTAVAAMLGAWVAVRTVLTEADLSVFWSDLSASAAALGLYVLLVRFAFPGTWAAGRKVARVVMRREKVSAGRRA